MKVRLTAHVNLRIWLVDWQALVPYWSKHWQYDAVKDEKLADAFLDLWFKKTKSNDGVRTFCVAHLDSWPNTETIAFNNGSHRTRVLAKHLRYVPVSARSNCYRCRAFKPHFIRQVKRDELIELPDLPILSVPDLGRPAPS